MVLGVVKAFQYDHMAAVIDHYYNDRGRSRPLFNVSAFPGCGNLFSDSDVRSRNFGTKSVRLQQDEREPLKRSHEFPLRHGNAAARTLYSRIVDCADKNARQWCRASETGSSRTLTHLKFLSSSSWRHPSTHSTPIHPFAHLTTLRLDLGAG
jgi:hypothetical protein